MNTIKYFQSIAFVGLLSGVSLVGCKSDDDLGEAPRLFRPITFLEAKSNKVVVTWDNIKGAETYELTLFKATGEEVDGKAIAKEYRQAATTSSPYIFEGVEWDEKYAVRIKAKGVNIESEYYDTKMLSVPYPTKLSGTKTIDVGVSVAWGSGGRRLTSLQITPKDGQAQLVTVTEAEYAAGKIEIYGLSPQTSYALIAYSGEEQTVDTYEGRLSFKTVEPVDYNTKYGEGKYLDLRAENSDEALTSTDFQSKLDATNGLAVILKGGANYTLNGLTLKNSVTFVTGMTLAGNAVIMQKSTIKSATGSTISKILFEDVDFQGSQYPLEGKMTKNGGSQVFNNNGSSAMVDEISFKNCRIEGYRGVVRMQAATDGVKKVVFDGCTINGVADQGVVTTNNTKATMNEITFSNSTITNIVMLADLRASASKPAMTIKDCTFCYAPVETTADANTPLLRFGSNAVDLSVSNTIFGPSLGTKDSGGSTVIPYTAGVKGSIFLNGSATSAGVTNSFKTNFGWAKIGAAETTYPLDGLTSLELSETVLFTDPANGNFKIKQSFDGAQTAGAKDWRMQ